MLNFIGMGSAFNTKLGNTSAYIKRDKSMILIDCGGTVFHKLQELNLLDGIENLHIIITHTHPDHVGSLGDVIFYSYYILNSKPKIYFPVKEWIIKYLTSIGVSSEMYILNCNMNINTKDFSIEFIPSSHVSTIPAFSFVMKVDNKCFYYSGDSNNISKDIINRIAKKDIQRAYQDTCGLDYNGNPHLSLKKLCELIPEKYRDRVYCMHLDNHITENKISDYGFRIVKVLKVN